MSGEATTVKDGAAATPSPTGAALEVKTPTTALEALKGAEARLSTPDPSPGTPESKPETPPAGAQPASTDGKPAAAAVADSPGVAQLRSAYEALKQRFAPYEQLGDHEEVANAVAQFKRLMANPLAFYRQLGTELSGIPEFKEQIQPAAEEPEPGPDLYTMVDGEKQLVYSAGQLKKWHEWNDKRIEKRMDERLNPMQEWVNRAQETTEEYTLRQQAQSTTTRVMTEMRKLPHFAGKENEEKIAEKLRSIPAPTRRELGAIGSLQMAYQMHLRDNVFPTIEASAEKKVREDAARKAAAATGNVKPGSGPDAATGKRPKNASELAAKMASGAYNQGAA